MKAQDRLGIIVAGVVGIILTGAFSIGIQTLIGETIGRIATVGWFVVWVIIVVSESLTIELSKSNDSTIKCGGCGHILVKHTLVEDRGRDTPIVKVHCPECDRFDCLSLVP